MNILVMFPLLLLLGEVTPKTIATSKAVSAREAQSSIDEDVVIGHPDTDKKTDDEAETKTSTCGADQEEAGDGEEVEKPKGGAVVS